MSPTTPCRNGDTLAELESELQECSERLCITRKRLQAGEDKLRWLREQFASEDARFENLITRLQIWKLEQQEP